MALERKKAWWTHDKNAHAYYFAPSTRPKPPYLKQIAVKAVIDVGADGTLAGVELAYGYLPPAPVGDPLLDGFFIVKPGTLTASQIRELNTQGHGVIHALPSDVSYIRPNANPPPSVEMIEVCQLLKDWYDPAQTATWLTSHQQLLGGQRPIDLIDSGRADEVKTVIQQLNEGVYL